MASKCIYPAVNETDATPLYFALTGGDFSSIGALPGVRIALSWIQSTLHAH